MKPTKYPYEIRPGVWGVITIGLDVPDKNRLVLAAQGYGPEEITNLVGQELQKILQDLGVMDGEGV